MEAITILNALPMNEWALKKMNGNISGIGEAVKRGLQFPETKEVAVITDAKNNFSFPENIKVVALNEFSSKEVFAAMYELAKKYRTVFFADADAPFLDSELAVELFQTHKKYKAEYTFADGYPKGLAPELLDVGLLKILSHISDFENVKENRNFIFDTLKKNINSYDIETVIAPYDVSELRLEFFTNSKRNFLLCENFKTIDSKNYSELIKKQKRYLFMLPAYYAVEISAKRHVTKIYQPKIEIAESKAFLNFEKFKIIIDKITAYSNDAVVSLSIFGEPFCNSEILSIIEYVLQQKELSLLLETSATQFDRSMIEKIRTLADAYDARSKIFWITMLDAVSENKYAELSSVEASAAHTMFQAAVENTLALHENFPGNVYPQFVRMNQNEIELEAFYNLWKEKINSVLIQKYDNLAGQIPQHRVADISPIKRCECWHLKRDMYILENGDVLMCREDAFRKNIIGNIFFDELETLHEKNLITYLEHVEKKYKGLCENCDEYYTYNF